jgi:hypothetical protein
MIRDTLRKCVAHEIAPYRRQREKDGAVPRNRATEDAQEGFTASFLRERQRSVAIHYRRDPGIAFLSHRGPPLLDAERAAFLGDGNAYQCHWA